MYFDLMKIRLSYLSLLSLGLLGCGQEATQNHYYPELLEFSDGITAGNLEGTCGIPEAALPEDVSNPDRIIGDGTPESCTSEAFIAAVAHGGVITFQCGPEPITIELTETAKVFNDSLPDIVIDGGGLVALSGRGTHRILYMNTCDENQHWTTPHCNNQDHPRLTVQNLTFVNGNSRSMKEYDGGGAIWARGGRLKIINSRFFNNVCAETGPDVGGGAVRAFDQYNSQAVYVVNSTFGGAEGYGNICSNGGALSSIGVNWAIYNSIFSYNEAIGNGGNPAQSGTPGGGSGGAIYNDGNTLHLSICGSILEKNKVNAFGAAIFFVSNNHDGLLTLRSTTIQENQGGSWHVLPAISMHDDTRIDTSDVILEH